jgi:hypothetical protein
MVQMTQIERRGISASQKQELWKRWERGQSMNDIARALAKHRASIQRAPSMVSREARQKEAEQEQNEPQVGPRFCCSPPETGGSNP